MSTTQDSTVTTATLPSDAEPVDSDASLELNPEAAAPEDSSQTPNSEAAKYRRRLCDVEAERDGERELRMNAQRQLAELWAGELLDQPADLFEIGGAQLAEMCGDDGLVSRDAVRERAELLLSQRPRLGVIPVRIDLGQGVRGSTTAGPDLATAIGDQLANARNRR